MDINLFDSNFIDSPCSVAYQTSKYISYIRDLAQFNGITLFTDEWMNHRVVDVVESKYKIGWLREPFCLHPLTYERSLDAIHHGKLDFILTYYQPFLNLDDRYKFAPYAGTWLPECEWGIRPKTRNISMLIGDKESTQGHILRKQIAGHYDKGIDFYGLKGQPVNYSWQTKFLTLNTYRYSIITETCKEDNLFTEWLLDAFMVGTIPIYWGCSNADEFFNTDGILEFDELNDLDYLLRQLQDDGFAKRLYQSLMPAIIDNLNISKQYAITEDWLYLNVFKGLE